MTKVELIQLCKIKAEACANRYDFKKKYGYWYKLCCKEKIMDEVFENYNSLERHYQNVSKKYTLEYLINFCKKTTKTELLNHNKSYYMLLTKYYKIDPSEISFRSRQAVKLRYDDQYLIEITKDLKYKMDFYTKYPKEYKYCKNKNYFNIICPHLIPFNISRPQLILKYLTDIIFGTCGSLNNRKILYPYEVDILYESINIGFEYNGKRWHLNNSNDIIKTKKSNEIGLKIITIVENSRDYEKDIKNQLINNIDEISKYVNYNISKEDLKINIDYDKIISFNIDYYKELSLKYVNVSEFSRGNNIEYNNCVKLGIMDVVSPHFIKKVFWTKSTALKEAKNYKNISELIKSKSGCYQFLLKNNLIKEFKFKTKRLLYKNVNSDYIIDNFTSINDLIKTNYPLYRYLTKNKKHLLSNLKFFSLGEISEVICESKTFSEFKRSKVYKLSYTKDQNKDFINNTFKKVNFNKYFILDINIDEIKDKCVMFDNIKMFRCEYPKVYKFILKNNLVNICFGHVNTLKFRNGLSKQ